MSSLLAVMSSFARHHACFPTIESHIMLLWKTTCCSLLLLTLLAGCGQNDAPEVYTLKGAITFDGKPIPAGTMTFFPEAGNTGPAGNAKIVNGQYTTQESGRGVVGGPHRIVVNGFDGKADPSAELPYGQPLFIDYEIKYDLPKLTGGKTEETIDFKVPKEAANPKRPRASTA